MKKIIFTALLSSLICSPASFAKDLSFGSKIESVKKLDLVDSKLGGVKQKFEEKKNKITAKCNKEEEALEAKLAKANGFIKTQIMKKIDGLKEKCLTKIEELEAKFKK
jgi:Skp family chaperone for outer membrane proteins